jgi:hypothetical protein
MSKIRVYTLIIIYSVIRLYRQTHYMKHSLFCINTFKYGGKIVNNQRKITIFAISFENY